MAKRTSIRMRHAAIASLCAAAPLGLHAALAADEDPGAPTPVSLGKKIFADSTLSASGTLACATCHDPANAHAQSNDLPVQLGGANRDGPGFRAVPSLRYSSFTPPSRFDDEGTPIGGFNRDGRANDLMAQAIRPLFAAHEMANESVAALLTRLASARYVDEFRKVFGARIFEEEDAALRAVLFALAQYEKLDPVFRPFDSKYDTTAASRISATHCVSMYAAIPRRLRFIRSMPPAPCRSSTTCPPILRAT